jgi:glycosyltransferase involved in cell wall biosynthesis
MNERVTQGGTAQVVASTPGLEDMALTAAVCIPTFRRPAMLQSALGSLMRQSGAPPFMVMVVDNDGAGREGAALAAGLIASGQLKGRVLVEPRQGNCKAYNAAWSHLRLHLPDVPFICGIDDDEEADAGWLAALITAAGAHRADIVGGTVIPIFSDERLNYLRQHPIFRSHYTADGLIPQLYSSANYLIRAGVLDAMGYPYLDEAFDYKGGGDTDFFTRARRAGTRFAWSNAARLTETMPVRRTEFSWIHARALRNGMISALIEHKADPGLTGRARTALKSAALLAAAPFRGLRDAAATGSGLIGLYHLQVALGRLGAEFGLNIEQYRNPEKN